MLCMFTNSLIEFILLGRIPMRDNTFDRTIERNYVTKWRFLIAEYEEVKAGRSPAFRRVGDFYKHHGTCSQTFRKYYNRYLQSGAEADFCRSAVGRNGVSGASRKGSRRRSSPAGSEG
ncbi:hypothetical protein ACVOMS_01445 [Bradyrhizobium guangxiense]